MTRIRNSDYQGWEDKKLVSESQCATNSLTEYLHSADSKHVFLAINSVFIDLILGQYKELAIDQKTFYEHGIVINHG